MIYKKSPSLASFLATLLASGRVVFTAQEAVAALGVTHGAFLDAVERLQRRHLVLNPKQGFYVVVPPQFAAWQAPPPNWYIHELMNYLGRPYYVGLLQAAQLHGATHQAVMEFQVITNKRASAVRAGRNRIVFYYRKNMHGVRPGLISWKTDTGSMHVSSPALTALDLIRYPNACAGLDHAAGVISDLAKRIDSKQMTILSAEIEKPVVQRLGFLLDWLGHSRLSQPMHEALFKKQDIRWVELDSKEVVDMSFARKVLERNQRWRVVIRRYPELDE